MENGINENDPVQKKIEDLIKKKADENAALTKLLIELDKSGSKQIKDLKNKI